MRLDQLATTPRHCSTIAIVRVAEAIAASDAYRRLLAGTDERAASSTPEPVDVATARERVYLMREPESPGQACFGKEELENRGTVVTVMLDPEEGYSINSQSGGYDTRNTSVIAFFERVVPPRVAFQAGNRSPDWEFLEEFLEVLDQVHVSLRTEHGLRYQRGARPLQTPMRVEDWETHGESIGRVLQAVGGFDVGPAEE